MEQGNVSFTLGKAGSNTQLTDCLRVKIYHKKYRQR